MVLRLLPGEQTGVADECHPPVAETKKTRSSLDKHQPGVFNALGCGSEPQGYRLPPVISHLASGNVAIRLLKSCRR